MSDENTQRRAYAIWENEGRPEGRQVQNWEQAARELYAAADPSPRPGAPAGQPILERPSGTVARPARRSAHR
jgi:hypothetical protein